jgi:hypothetical protein
MYESTYFGASLLGLVIAMAAEHMIRHKAYYKGTTREKVWLGAARVFIALFAFVALCGLPNMGSSECRPDPLSQYPMAECN